MEEFLKSLGFTAGSVLLLCFFAYLGRQFFESILKSIAAANIENLQQQNRIDIEKLKNQYDSELQDRRVAFDRQIEHLKSALSVESETYRVAAQKRFDCLISLWEKSEALLTDTDFSEPEEIHANLVKVQEAVKDLNRKSVLLSPETTEDVRKYLEHIETVLTHSEQEFEEGKAAPRQQNAIPEIPITIGLAGFLGVTIDVGKIVKSASKILEKYRFKSSLEARARLELALRREFGVQISGALTAPEQQKAVAELGDEKSSA